MFILGIIVVVGCIILNHYYKKQYPQRKIMYWLMQLNVLLQLIIYVGLAVLLWKAGKFDILILR